MVNEKLLKQLIELGSAQFRQPYRFMEFTGNKEADTLLNDLGNHPHAFVLGSIMDAQIKAEKAWMIPWEVSKEIGGFGFFKLLRVEYKEFKKIFGMKSLHRFNNEKSRCFYEAIHKIHRDYENDASNIWTYNLRSRIVVDRFMAFRGVGIKIATMAANILARDFKVPMKNYFAIDISPDVHIRRVFKRLGFVDWDAKTMNFVKAARKLYPEYPGIMDGVCWEIGRKYCWPNYPLCKNCIVREECPKII